MCLYKITFGRLIIYGRDDVVAFRLVGIPLCTGTYVFIRACLRTRARMCDAIYYAERLMESEKNRSCEVADWYGRNSPMRFRRLLWVTVTCGRDQSETEASLKIVYIEHTRARTCTRIRMKKKKKIMLGVLSRFTSRVDTMIYLYIPRGRFYSFSSLAAK